MLFAIYGANHNYKEMPLIAFVQANNRSEACEMFAKKRYADGIYANSFNPRNHGYHLKGWPEFRLEAKMVTREWLNKQHLDVVMEDLAKDKVSCRFEETAILTPRWNIRNITKVKSGDKVILNRNMTRNNPLIGATGTVVSDRRDDTPNHPWPIEVVMDNYYDTIYVPEAEDHHNSHLFFKEEELTVIG